MRLIVFLIAASLAFSPGAFAQNSPPPVFRQIPAETVPAPAPIRLPDLGDASGADLPLQAERKLGESIMREIRFREPSYLDDPEIAEYLNGLGAQLSAAAPGARQDFELFAIRDSSINAFALPGGYIGVHTGLISASDNESEIASVLSHEMAHVTQHHIARGFGVEKQAQIPMMIAMAAAILLARSRPDLANGVTMAAQGGAIQSQLSYSRDFEREADRIGFQTLSASGFDVRAMAEFFEKLQRYTRIMDSGSVPVYLRSHPVTTERISEAQDRAQRLPLKQHTDSLEYHLVRAKVRAEAAAEPRDAVTLFTKAVSDRRFANEPGAHYGLAIALLRANEPKQAAAEVARLRADKIASPMIETLDARVRFALGDKAGAIALLKDAMIRYPHRRPILYALLDALQEQGRYDEVLALLAEPLRLYPRDAKLHEARARAYASQGKRLLQHQAQAEVYVLQGSLPAAIEQLQLAQTSGDGNFYDQSVVEARLKELRAEHARELQDAKKRQ
ncbi:MAG TPA: M48 family metalloprotease [Burkholderiales bacterium]|nr:M48 family metalloprotease [Burkholderiales bacterium]